MRNLKKILALVLALVMSLSLMATAGAGSFQDVTDDNPYKTAIDVLDELKVFQGFEDGSFKPTESLNRAQAAVLVYRIATGDVEGKYVANYTDMAQSKFDDLTGYEWARGYINYCQNAKIVVGTSATKFSPEKNVTGYQLMVMLLRTLGYGAAGEFADPTSWELETAKIAEREGILKNITGGNYGEAAPRQMVAEILFQGLLQETVTYSALTSGGYTKSGEILGKRVGLEEITGVVIANEIASLIDDAPLAEGKTWLDVDGKTVRLDVASKGEDLGTMVHAYVKDSKPITGLTDAGTNDIKTNEGANTTVSKLKGTLKLTDETQYFTNFGELLTDTSDYRIEYNVPQAIVDTLKYTDEQMSKNGCTIDGKKPNSDGVYTSVTGDTWNKVIRVGNTITGMDLSIIHEIFTYDDAKVAGEVFAGTQTDKDLSDEISWNKFKAEYLNRDVKDALEGCDNGESLRVIDNNGDGIADYVLRVEFVMTVITDYESRTETYTVEYDEDASDRIKGTEIKAGDIVCADELAIGDVILYAKIDGVYYVSHPETETVKIDKKSINTKAGTFTVDGETYTWSEIDEKATAYYEELVELSHENSYTLYKDWFGYIRLAADPSRDFYLLTDGYFYTNKRESTKQAQMFVGGELGDYDVKDFEEDLSTPAGFIDESEESDNSPAGNRGTWKRLRAFEKVYENLVIATDADDLDGDGDPNLYDFPSEFATNIAAAALSDDVYSLDRVDDNTILRYDRLYNAYEIGGTKEGVAVTTGDNGTLKAGDVKSNDRTLWGIDGYSADNTSYSADTRIQTRTDTVYYYVYWDNDGVHVDTWTGYNGSDAPKAFVPELAYAVTYDSLEGDYQIASVVVFEAAYEENRPDAWLVTEGNTINSEWALGPDDEGYDRVLKKWGLFDKDELALAEKDLLPELLTLRDEDGDELDPDVDTYSDYGVYAGTVTVGGDVTRGDYVRIREDNTSHVEYFATSGVDSWELVLDPDQVTNARKAIDPDKGERLSVGDKVIYMTNDDGDVALIVNVTKSYVKGDENDKIERLVDLQNTIAAQQNDNKSIADLIAEAKKAVADKDTLSAEYLADLVERLTDAANRTDITVADKNTITGYITTLGTAALANAKTEAEKELTDFAAAKKAEIDANVDLDATEKSVTKAAVDAALNAAKTAVTDATTTERVKEALAAGLKAISQASQPADNTPVDKEPVVDGGTATTPPVTSDEIQGAINAGEGVTITVTTDDETVKEVRVPLEKDAVDALVESNQDTKVETPVGDVTVPSEALDQAIGDATDVASVEVVIAEAETDVTTDTEGNEVDLTNAAIVDVTIVVTKEDGTSSEAEIAGLSDKITITIDYTAADDTEVDVYYVKDVDGVKKLEKVTGGPWTVSNNKVTITVDHLTVFAVVEPEFTAEELELIEAIAAAEEVPAVDADNGATNKQEYYPGASAQVLRVNADEKTIYAKESSLKLVKPANFSDLTDDERNKLIAWWNGCDFDGIEVAEDETITVENTSNGADNKVTVIYDPTCETDGTAGTDSANENRPSYTYTNILTDMFMNNEGTRLGDHKDSGVYFLLIKEGDIWHVGITPADGTHPVTGSKEPSVWAEWTVTFVEDNVWAAAATVAP